jgi:RteC protein
MKRLFSMDSFIENIKGKYPTTIKPALEEMSREELENLTALRLTEIAFPDINLMCNNSFESQKSALQHKLDFELTSEGRINALIKEFVQIRSYLTTKLALWFLGYIDLSIIVLIERVKVFDNLDGGLGESIVWDMVARQRKKEFDDSSSQIEEIFGNGINERDLKPTDDPNEDLRILWNKIEPKLPYSLPKFVLKLTKQREYLKYIKHEIDSFLESQKPPIVVMKEDTQIEKDKLTWKGRNETEFVQFAYSLFHSNLLKNENDQITKFVPLLAQAFNLELGNNWIDNHSKSVKKRNTDYKPEIFDTLKSGYDKYLDLNKAKTKKS